MTFIPFQLEQWQSEYEDHVLYNLADSGVHPVAVSELVQDPQGVEKLLQTRLHYPPVSGTVRLRELIAGLYKKADADKVLVTVGAAEANIITLQALLEPGDHVVAMEPCYRQLWGTVHNLGCSLTPYSLDAKAGWKPNLDQLEASVTQKTKLIGVTNPNNPTGIILTPPEMQRIIKIAERHHCWLLADEVYRGTERLTDTETPSFYGEYDRVIAVNSLSKAYGLSGLRTGWVVGPHEIIQAIHRRHEYSTISTGMLSMTLAEIALAEPMRSHLFQRNRELIREGYQSIENWVNEHPDGLSIVPPQSTALAFVRYNMELSSIEVAEILLERASVLVAPGEYFGIDRHLRITHGLQSAYLEEALQRMTGVMESLLRTE